jgi:hypothetical protein
VLLNAKIFALGGDSGVAEGLLRSRQTTKKRWPAPREFEAEARCVTKSLFILHGATTLACAQNG